MRKSRPTWPRPPEWLFPLCAFALFLLVCLAHEAGRGEGVYTQRSDPPERQSVERVEGVERERPASLLEGERININTAPSEELQRLPGIGPSRAEAIIERRTSLGPFREKRELLEIRGIGEATFQALEDYITLDG